MSTNHAVHYRISLLLLSQRTSLKKSLPHISVAPLGIRSSRAVSVRNR
jgi:hypothetical protein